MSGVHVYGVVPARGPEAPDGARLIRHRKVAALVGDVGDREPTAPSLLRLHWRILEEAGLATTVLPLRFGTIMSGDREVVDDFLAPAHDELEATLDELSGKVQLTVKGYYEEEALMRGVLEGSPTVARLRERVRGMPEEAAYYDRIRLGELVAAEVGRARERDSAAIVERLAPLALDHEVEQVTRAEQALNAAFLVERDGVSRFSDAVQRLGLELDGRIRLRYVGPLPPYSFTSQEIQAGGAWA